MDWIPAISTTFILSIILWLSRNLIITRLRNSVKHEYDAKIEAIRTELKKNEEAFKSELQAKASQIDALRSGALSGIVNRQAVLYERQLKASEQLWGTVVSLAPAKTISAWVSTLKFDVAAKEAATNPKFREIFKALGSAFDVKALQTTDASIARPFVSPLLWAYYSAYLAIVMHAVLKMQMLQSGIEKDYSDVEAIKKLVKIALPHHKDYIDKYGPSAFHYLLEELESKLIVEINNILKGQESDKENIEKAALILKESERLMEDISKSKNKGIA